MKKKSPKINLEWFKKGLPYILIATVTLFLVIFGSLDKHSNGPTLSLSAFAKEDYQVSVDQLSELYVIADLSDALGLASAGDVASNYVLTTSMRSAGQTSTTGKLEKPQLTNITASRGVISYTVSEGESMESIAAKYGVSTDQIRWSNGLKTTEISAGNTLYIPSSSGIVYTVKSGDTADSIAEKYGSSSAEIIALNDLELTGITEGARIFIKNGSLPETERPEYVPPAPVYNYNYTYSYLGNSSTRQNIQMVGVFYGLGGPYYGGQCTQWAWYNRQDLPSSLGNANTWAARAAAIGYRVDRTPSAGAIFQTSSGWYGHVGYVESVNSDGSIVVTEMNYSYVPYSVIRATIPASAVGSFYYIH